MKYEDIVEEAKLNNDVVSFDKYTIGNVYNLIKNCESSYFIAGSVYVDVPTQFYFDEFFERFQNKIKWIALLPTCHFTEVGQVVTKIRYFDSLDEFDEFLKKNYGHLLIYSVNKQIDSLNLNQGYKWRIRFELVSNKEDIRDEKLEDILK